MALSGLVSKSSWRRALVLSCLENLGGNFYFVSSKVVKTWRQDMVLSLIEVSRERSDEIGYFSSRAHVILGNQFI